MKKIISSLIALSMTISMTCTTAFAIDNTAVPNQNNFVYTDEVLQTYGGVGIATMSLDEYEPNDFENPYGLGAIEAKSRPLREVNASVNDTDDIMDGYSISAYEGGPDEFDVVDELVVLLGGLSNGDRLVMIITDENDEEIASGVVDGSNGSGAYITFPTNGKGYYGSYNIYIALASVLDGSTGYNSEVNYKLQIASRYVRNTQQFYARTTAIKYSGSYADWSQAGYMYIRESDAPKSAIVNSMFVNGTLINTRTGKQSYVSILRLWNGDKEIAGGCPDTLKNLDRFELPVVGTWTIKYLPYFDKDYIHELRNFSAKIDYTYDILVG